MTILTRKNIIAFSMVLVCTLSILSFCLPVNVSALYSSGATDTNSSEIADIQTMSAKEIETLFQIYGLDYFAYMDINTVDSALAPIILAARYHIANNHSWVYDGGQAWIEDETGNVIEVLPYFHDIFPEDWDYPSDSHNILSEDWEYLPGIS